MKRKVTGEKLHKVLARAGFGSRRTLEGWIASGRVRVNGAIATVGMRVGAGDRLEVDGRRVDRRRLEPASIRVLRYHKPEGEICTRRRDSERRSVFDALPRLKNGRWIAVGRLDVNSSGLLLFTNDGRLAHRLMHPSSGLEREYAVRVRGTVTEETVRTLQSGVRLDDGPAKFDRIVDKGGEGANHWYHVTLREGRNREVRRLWASQGAQVSRLMRVRYGPVSLPRGLPRGRWEELSEPEVEGLISAVHRTSARRPAGDAA